VPGAILHRPVYAPALVAFVGAGHGGVMRNGGFRWFPLGPREAYVPPYQASREYIQKVNIRHVQVRNHETLEAPKTQYIHRDAYRYVDSDPPQVFAQVLQQLFTAAVRNDEERKHSAVNAQRRQVEVRRAPMEQKEPTEQKLQNVRKKKKLPNGQWVWVEEWVEE
jgi:hypothetical protein